MKLLIESWKRYLSEQQQETDSVFLQRMIKGDQELRNLFAKDVKEAGGWSQELVNKFIIKHNTAKDDAFGDRTRMEEFIQREPSFNHSGFSDEDWNNYYIFVMHMDNYPKMQFKALKLFEDKFGRFSDKHKNLLFRMARHREMINIPKNYTLNLNIIDDEAKKFNVDWQELSSKLEQS